MKKSGEELKRTKRTIQQIVKRMRVPRLYASERPSSFCGKCAFISSPSKSALYALQLA